MDGSAQRLATYMGVAYVQFQPMQSVPFYGLSAPDSPSVSDAWVTHSQRGPRLDPQIGSVLSHAKRR